MPHREPMHKRDALEAFDILRRELGWDRSYVLDTHSPGDHVTRYRIETISGALPLGRRYWLGAREATVAMLAIIYAFQYEKEQGRIC